MSAFTKSPAKKVSDKAIQQYLRTAIAGSGEFAAASEAVLTPVKFSQPTKTQIAARQLRVDRTFSKKMQGLSVSSPAPVAAVAAVELGSPAVEEVSALPSVEPVAFALPAVEPVVTDAAPEVAVPAPTFQEAMQTLAAMAPQSTSVAADLMGSAAVVVDSAASQEFVSKPVIAQPEAVPVAAATSM
jgi:hypothetical protein